MPEGAALTGTVPPAAPLARRSASRDPAAVAAPARRRRHGLPVLLFVGGVALALSALAFTLVYRLSMSHGLGRMQEAAERRLDLGTAALETTWARFEYLPALLETTPAVLALLNAPDDAARRDAANRALARINANVGSAMLFVLEPGGLAVAASDWERPDTPLGHRYDYRPYMKGALASGRGRFFGIGATTKKPGYFLSYALKEQGRTLGVATVKVDLAPAEWAWRAQPGETLLTDHHGVVVLSTREDWRFHALQPLGDAARAQIEAERSYPADLPVLAWLQGGMPEGLLRAVAIDGVEHLFTSRNLAELGWQLHVVESTAPAQAAARVQATVAALLAAVAWLLGVAAWQSRHAAMQKLATQAALQDAYDWLEDRVEERTRELQVANASLAAEVNSRKAVERSLRSTQDELVHAARMAVLGQLSAGLAHELNQPLAALRTLSDNAQLLIDRQRIADTRANLDRISQIVERLAQVTRRLRSFAHKPDGKPVPTSLQAAAGNAAALLADRIRRDDVAFDLSVEPPQLAALADPALLEQVLVNLLVNGLDAMADGAERRLSLRASAQGGRVRVAITDSGSGIDPAMMGRLFEPFATTKPRGAGLGLGLMISRRIVRDCGGDIFASNNPGGGATFEIELPAASTAAVAASPQPA